MQICHVMPRSFTPTVYKYLYLHTVAAIADSCWENSPLEDPGVCLPAPPLLN